MSAAVAPSPAAASKRSNHGGEEQEYRPREIVQNAMNRIHESKQRMEKRKSKSKKQSTRQTYEHVQAPFHVITNNAAELPPETEEEPSLTNNKPLPIPERCYDEEGLFVYMVLQDSTVVLSRPSDDAMETRLSFDTHELISGDLIQHSTFQQTFGEDSTNSKMQTNSQASMEFVRLTDRTGWLPLQQFVANEVGGFTAVPRLRPVTVERGLWTLYVDNAPRGQYLRRHPVESQDLNVELMTHTHNYHDNDDDESEDHHTVQPVLYQPFQKVYCHARVTHPVTGITYYRVQGAVAGWLMDRRMPTAKDPVVRSMLLPEECVMLGQLYCFKAMHHMAVRSSPTVADHFGTPDTVPKGSIISVDVIRNTNAEEEDALINGPYLRLTDERGWLFVKKHGTPVMVQVPCRLGTWQLKVVSEHLRLLQNPSFVAEKAVKNAVITIIPEGTILLCDYQMTHDGGEEDGSDEEDLSSTTFYHIHGGGWVCDSTKAGRPTVEILDEQPDSNFSSNWSSALQPWNVDYVRGMAACFDLQEQAFQESSPQRVLILTARLFNTAVTTGANHGLSSTSFGGFSQYSKSSIGSKVGLTLTFYVFCQTRSISFTVEYARRKRSYSHKTFTYKCNGAKLESNGEKEGENAPLVQSNHYNLAKDDIGEIFQRGIAALKSTHQGFHEEEKVDSHKFPRNIGIAAADSTITASTFATTLTTNMDDSASYQVHEGKQKPKNNNELDLRHQLVECEAQLLKLRQHHMDLLQSVHEFDVMRFQQAINGKSHIKGEKISHKEGNQGPHFLPSATPQNKNKHTKVRSKGKNNKRSTKTPKVSNASTKDSRFSPGRNQNNNILADFEEEDAPPVRNVNVQKHKATVNRLLETFSEIESKHERVSSSNSRRNSLDSKSTQEEAPKCISKQEERVIRPPRKSSFSKIVNKEEAAPRPARKNSLSNKSIGSTHSTHSKNTEETSRHVRKNSLSSRTLDSDAGSVVERISLNEKGYFCGECDSCFDSCQERDRHCRKDHELYCAKCDLTFTTYWRLEKHRKDVMHVSESESSDEEDDRAHATFKSKEVEDFMKGLHDD